MTDAEDERRRDLQHRLTQHAAIAASLWRSGVPCAPTPDGVHLTPEIAQLLAHHLVANPVRPHPHEGAPPWPAKPSSTSSATSPPTPN